MTDVLGYERFAVAGGDGGSVLAQILAIDHPEAVIGIHLTDLGWQASNVDPSSLSRTEQKYLEASRNDSWRTAPMRWCKRPGREALRPALNDSPVGLASWIVDRFHSWSDSATSRTSFSRDDLLTNIMLYWVTRTIGSSMFNYYAEARSPSLTPADQWIGPWEWRCSPRTSEAFRRAASPNAR